MVEKSSYFGYTIKKQMDIKAEKRAQSKPAVEVKQSAMPASQQQMINQAAAAL
jgi:hypothetical protein